MVFSSLVFLWLFLPIVLGVYFLAQEKYRNLLLLIASLFFYAWGEPIYVLVMIVSISVNYVCGLLIGHQAKKRLALIIGIVINLSLLGVFKYSGFVIENINALTGLNLAIKPLSLPIGISFYTFQSISYLVDIYRGVCQPQKNIIKMGLFISFFPQLIAGPILKYYDLAAQIDNRHTTWAMANEGAVRFIVGLSKKVIIANIMAKTADEVFAMNMVDISTIDAWIGIIAYTFQIYFDFSGYSDMAIGLGKIFGFKINENFNYPYLANSIRDFWRRWHISLSTWFKEYLYIPLGGNRVGTLKTYRNLLIVFFMTGLWHGASWNFVVWGMWHGFFIVFEKIIPIEKFLRWRLLQNAYTLLVVICGWVLFRADNLPQAIDYLQRMFVPYQLNVATSLWGKEFQIVLVLAIMCSGWVSLIYQKITNRCKQGETFLQIVRPIWCVGILYLSIILLASNTYNPFIYFRF